MYTPPNSPIVTEDTAQVSTRSQAFKDSKSMDYKSWNTLSAHSKG